MHRIGLRVATLFSALGLLVGSAFSQARGALELFQGGIVSARLNLGSLGTNAFTGVFPGIGGGFAQLTPGAESVRWNPVGLAFIRRSQLYSEWLPPLRIDPQFLNLQSTLNTELRKALAPYLPDESSVYRDMNLQHRLLLEGGQGSYAAILRTRNFTMGAAINSPTRLRADLGISGMKFRAVTQSGSGGTQIRLLAILSGTASLEFDLSGLTLAVGRRLGERFAFGLAFDSYSASIKVNGFFQPQAQVSTGSEAYAFNDPSAGHYNRLEATASGTFTGEGGRWRLGMGYHRGQDVAIDAALFLPAQIDFHGRLQYAYNQILAFDLDPDNDRPFFDANQLLRDNFTGTHPRYTTVEAMRLNLPAALALAAAFRWGRAMFAFSYVNYFRNAALDFRYQFGGDSTAVMGEGRGRWSFGPERAFFVNFGLRWLQVRIGAFKISGGSEWSGGRTGMRFSTWGPILGFSGGFPLPYLRRFRLDYDLSAGLTTFLRLGTSFYF
ncbi:MAG: hypothetical protein Q9P14_07175 [candidate division KSB1 bacterium]|nr:hypothetical protein [candidate division KSB1 bacterium]MDQ7063536.1 hypothetical protein [candidate division KSB1 bacterium]